jgi:hypothetical protein
MQRETIMETTEEKFPTIYRVFGETGVFADHEILMERKPVYDELRSLIEPHLGGAAGMHVRVLCPHLNAWTDMFIDAVGAMKCLPRNDAATKIFRYASLSKHPGDDPEKLPYIVSPAVVFLRSIWGDEVGEKALGDAVAPDLKFCPRAGRRTGKTMTSPPKERASRPPEDGLQKSCFRRHLILSLGRFDAKARRDFPRFRAGGRKTISKVEPLQEFDHENF